MKYAALFALLLVACSAPAEWVREYPGYLPGADSENMVVLSVRDAETGAPIAGARIRHHFEHRPTEKAEWGELIAEATSDEYGLAWVQSRGGGDQWAAHADGYASTSWFGGMRGSRVLLTRGDRYHGRILDPFGAPLVGARVAYVLGCPHAPSLDRTVTDASGRFEFTRATNGQWPMTHPEVEAVYVSARTVDLPPPVFAAMPARPIEGRIVMADGSAPRWAVVQNECSPRGPLTLVRKDGRFTVRGGTARSGLTVYFRETHVDIPVHAYPGEYPFTFVVGAKEEDDARVVLVRTVDDLELDAVLVRNGDGRTVAIKTDIEADVPAGEYRVEVGSAFTRYRMSVDVPADGRLTVELKEQASLAITFAEDNVANDISLRLLLDGEWMYLEPPYDVPIYLPREGRAVLFAELEGARAWLPVGAVADGRRAVTVRMPPQKRIRLPGLGRDSYFEIHGDDTWSEPQLKSDGELVTIRASGRVVAEYGSVRAEFDLPEMATGVIEPIRVERVELAADAGIRLLLPDGSPALASEVWFNGEPSMADEDGVAWVPGACDGTRLSLVQQNSNFAAHHVTLHGSGPYTLQWGACSLRFAIPGVAKPLVWLDGAVRKLRKDLILEGLVEGPHTLIIGAPGRKHFVMRVVLKPGETRVIDLALPRISARISAKRSSPR